VLALGACGATHTAAKAPTTTKAPPTTATAQQTAAQQTAAQANLQTALTGADTFYTSNNQTYAGINASNIAPGVGLAFVPASTASVSPGPISFREVMTAYAPSSGICYGVLDMKASTDTPVFPDYPETTATGTYYFTNQQASSGNCKATITSAATLSSNGWSTVPPTTVPPTTVPPTTVPPTTSPPTTQPTTVAPAPATPSVLIACEDALAFGQAILGWEQGTPYNASAVSRDSTGAAAYGAPLSDDVHTVNSGMQAFAASRSTANQGGLTDAVSQINADCNSLESPGPSVPTACMYALTFGGDVLSFENGTPLSNESARDANEATAYGSPLKGDINAVFSAMQAFVISNTTANQVGVANAVGQITTDCNSLLAGA
jgi:hypothetical protein